MAAGDSHPPAELERYQRLLEETLDRSAQGSSPPPDANGPGATGGPIVLAGTMWGWPVPAVLERWLVQLAETVPDVSVLIADRAGHRRPAYRGLLLHAAARVGRSELLRPWYASLAEEVGRITIGDGPIPAARGEQISSAAWAALSISAVAGHLAEPRWREAAGWFFRAVASAQRADGAFFRAGPSDNRETLGYHELVLLHATATFAVEERDEDLRAAVFRAVEHVQDEVQPDHSTSQPWGLFAAIWNPATRPLADQLLHAATAARGAGDDAVSWMLLSDSLYCLKKLTAAQPPAAE